MTCAQECAALAEPLAGTATTCDYWLVIEQPGAYAGREALLTSGFPAAAGQQLHEAVRATGGKVAMVRRPGRHPLEQVEKRRVWRVSGRPTVARYADFDDPAEIVDWVLAKNADQFGHIAREPVLLICTHGKRDVCCARAGRDLLAGAAPLNLWESSHLGGHRFAPVVLELTTGYLHGQVAVADLSAIAEAAASGEVYLPTCRGHFALTPAEQAAELAALALGATGPLSVRTDGAGIALTGPRGELRARVESVPLGLRPESCGASPGPAVEFRVDLEET